MDVPDFINAPIEQRVWQLCNVWQILNTKA